MNAGIGGTATALTLGMRGHHVTIFEAAPQVRNVLNRIWTNQLNSKLH